MMKALIVDDERLAREELKRLLDGNEHVEVVGECSNGKEAIEFINKNSPDLVFLDVQMPGMDGFEVLEGLKNCPNVIFVTAYDEYAIKAFEVNALDYLLKPVEQSRLDEAINRLAQEEGSEASSQKLGGDERIFIKDGEKCWFVKLSDVRMFESVGNYVKVHFDDKRPMILRSLNALEERLDESLFFRANRKEIINLNWIKDIEPWFNGGLRVQLSNGEFVEISRRQASRFKEMKSI